jgi:hypothetical protein
MSKLFKVGSDWRHKTTGLVVYIQSITPKGVRLATKDVWIDRALLRQLWQPREVIAEFELVDNRNYPPPSAWDRLRATEDE